MSKKHGWKPGTVEYQTLRPTETTTQCWKHVIGLITGHHNVCVDEQGLGTIFAIRKTLISVPRIWMDQNSWTYVL